MTFDKFLPFAKPCLDDFEIEEILDSLHSGWITTGPKVAKFEELLTSYHSGRRALCLTSATAGLHLALLGLGLGKGDEVITTPFTFVATLNTIELTGAKPILVDINPATLNIDEDKIEAAITERTKAIMPVHFAGLPVDLDKIYALAKKYNLRVIEDAAHAIGAEFNNKRLGTFGDIQVMSFHPNKNITTGEGGCVISNDEELLNRIERLRFHGIDRNAFNRFSKAGSTEYDVVVPGYKYNMMDIQAALGIHQLPKLAGFIARRTQAVSQYRAELMGISGLSFVDLPSYPHKHAWHLMNIWIDKELAGFDRNEFINKLKEQNIGTGVHYKSAHLFSYYANKYGWKPESYPESTRIGETICSLPLFPQMDDATLGKIILIIKKIFKHEI